MIFKKILFDLQPIKQNVVEALRLVYLKLKTNVWGFCILIMGFLRFGLRHPC